MEGTHSDMRSECASNDPEFFIFGLFDGSTPLHKISLSAIVGIIITVLIIIGLIIWCIKSK